MIVGGLLEGVGVKVVINVADLILLPLLLFLNGSHTVSESNVPFSSH